MSYVMGKYDEVEHLGEAVQQRIRELGYTRADAPWELLGATEASLSRWRRGRQQISDAGHLEAVRQFLGVSDAEWGRLRMADDLYFGREEMARARPVLRALEALLRSRQRDGGAGL
jgi:hypothetical protein